MVRNKPACIILDTHNKVFLILPSRKQKISNDTKHRERNHRHLVFQQILQYITPLERRVSFLYQPCRVSMYRLPLAKVSGVKLDDI